MTWVLSPPSQQSLIQIRLRAVAADMQLSNCSLGGHHLYLCPRKRGTKAAKRGARLGSGQTCSMYVKATFGRCRAHERERQSAETHEHETECATSCRLTRTGMAAVRLCQNTPQLSKHRRRHAKTCHMAAPGRASKAFVTTSSTRLESEGPCLNTLHFWPALSLTKTPGPLL